jgi:hypothetical protein
MRSHDDATQQQFTHFLVVNQAVHAMWAIKYCKDCISIRSQQQAKMSRRQFQRLEDKPALNFQPRLGLTWTYIGTMVKIEKFCGLLNNIKNIQYLV